MNKLNTLKCLAFLIGSVAITSCSKDNPAGKDQEPIDQGKEKFVFVVSGQGSSETGGTGTYVVSTDDVSKGSLSLAGNGLASKEFSFAFQNNHLFGLVYGGQGEVTPYKVDNSGKLVRLEDETVNALVAGVYGTYGDKNIVMGTTTRSLSNPIATLTNYDAENFQIAGKNTVDLSKVLGGKRMAIWTGLFQVGSKIYIPFQSGDGSNNWGGDFTTIDTTYIGVFSYPDLKFEKTIKDGRGSHIGNWFSQQGIAEAADGYAYAWFTADAEEIKTKNHSGFLRVNKETNEFDKGYYFDVEALGNGKIARGSYLKGSKFLMTVYDKGSTAEGIGGGNVKLYIVDIQAKTMTAVNGVPVHEQFGYNNKVHVDKDGKKAYYVLQDPTDKQFYVYVIDTEKATGTKGLQFLGVSDVTAISKLNY